jgi:two-component system chemotaxis response regulator CheB
MQALASGAVAIVAKPKAGVKNFLLDASADLVEAVKAAAGAQLRNLRPRVATTSAEPVTSSKASADHVVAIGTSTGGTQALEVVLSALPLESPGIVVVQHMPERFTSAFSQRLDGVCRIEVKEAQDNDRVLPGRALVAPGGKQMTVKRNGASYYVEVRSAPPVNRHCPSVDVLFRSVAKCVGRNALGIIMTGMGNDGARGLLQMRQAGARTIAQDEATSVVFGMPKEAIKLGAADRILPVQSIPTEILRG